MTPRIRWTGPNRKQRELISATRYAKEAMRDFSGDLNPLIDATRTFIQDLTVRVDTSAAQRDLDNWISRRQEP